MISIIVFTGKDANTKKCIDSITFQTYKNTEILIINNLSSDKYVINNYGAEGLSQIDTVNGNLSLAIQKAILGVKANYVILIPTECYFENDTALEDALLNVQNEDIVLFDTVCNKGNDPFSREHIICANIDNASALITADVFRFHSIFFKKDFLIKNGINNVDFSDYQAINLMLCNAVLNNKCQWSHLQIPILHIEANRNEINKAFKINYNENYKASLQRIAPLLYNDYLLLQSCIVKESNEEQKILQKFGKTIFFKLILKFRNQLFKTSYYDKKAVRRTKAFNEQQAQKDAARKIEVEKAIEALPTNMLMRKNNASDIVVSLTSHKRRVIDSAPYAIYSIFTQTVLPNRVVLFINKEHWNNDNLPPIIKRLMLSGLEVEFCEDVRSHTKLIPALQKFPENRIITIDDDIYYNEKTIEELLDAYKLSDGKTVICHQGCYPQKRNGKFLPYSNWEILQNNDTLKIKTTLTISAYGVSGVIYPPNVFPEEVFNKEVFLKIAPHTDDIWFWIMQYQNNINVKLVEKSSKDKNIGVNYAEYINPNESLALYFENCFNGRNDKELKALLEYYGIE